MQGQILSGTRRSRWTGNSFTIRAGEFLQWEELGEKYTVEYQVMITTKR